MFPNTFPPKATQLQKNSLHYYLGKYGIENPAGNIHRFSIPKDYI